MRPGTPKIAAPGTGAIFIRAYGQTEAGGAPACVRGNRRTNAKAQFR